jgi:hypothetical protein
MSNTSKRLADLSPDERRALLAERLREKAGELRSSPPSFAQQRLRFLEQFAPGTPVYNISAAVLLRGPLDVIAL